MLVTCYRMDFALLLHWERFSADKTKGYRSQSKNEHIIQPPENLFQSCSKSGQKIKSWASYESW